MNYRYSSVSRLCKSIYRNFFPIPKSPYTNGKVANICDVHLVPPEYLEAFFERSVKILQNIKGLSIGDYLEFGVFNGSSISSMWKVVKKTGLENTRLFGFDAFEGLPAHAENEDNGVWKKGFYNCSFEQMQDCLHRKGLLDDEITWVKGWYVDTLTTETKNQYSIGKLGIIFIDCDTYSSADCVLKFISPLITEPVIICCDDWKLNNLDILGMGEYKAFNEFLEQNTHLVAQEVKSYNRKSKSFLVKPI